MNLFELTQEQLRLNEMLEENGGELTPEIEEALSINSDNLVAKAEGYCKAIAMYNADIDAFSAEIKRLTERKKVAQNAVDRMKNAMLVAMQALDINEIKAGTFKVGTSKSSSLNVLDESLVPDCYKNVETVISVDKNAVKAALKSGEEIGGVEIVEKKNIRIR